MQTKTARHDTLGEFEQSILLAIVHLGPDAYGVRIRREIEGRLDREVVIGALYTTLDRLERKGFVQSAISASTAERGGRSRRLFALRQPGAVALKDARERHRRMWQGLSPSLKRTSS